VVKYAVLIVFNCLPQVFNKFLKSSHINIFFLFRLKGYFENDSYVGSVPSKIKKGKKHTTEANPAKKIYMDDDGLYVVFNLFNYSKCQFVSRQYRPIFSDR